MKKSLRDRLERIERQGPKATPLVGEYDRHTATPEEAAACTTARAILPRIDNEEDLTWKHPTP